MNSRSTSRGDDMFLEGGNPLSDKVRQDSSSGRDSLPRKIEVVNDAHPIQQRDVELIIKELQSTENFEERMKIIEERKQPFLFTSTSLIKILEDISSIKTKLAIIQSIGPRLTDPKAKMNELLNMFRYSEDKLKVEFILKSRATAISSSVFKTSSGSSVIMRTARGVGGSRNGITPTVKKSSKPVTTPKGVPPPRVAEDISTIPVTPPVSAPTTYDTISPRAGGNLITAIQANENYTITNIPIMAPTPVAPLPKINPMKGPTRLERMRKIAVFLPKKVVAAGGSKH